MTATVPRGAAGAVVAMVLVAILIVGLIRVVWIRRGDHAGKLVQPSVLLAAGLVSIIFFLGLAATRRPPRASLTSPSPGR